MICKRGDNPTTILFDHHQIEANRGGGKGRENPSSLLEEEEELKNGWESRKWVMLIASIWIQAFTGTNFDFSSYSTEFKSVLDITQLQLNYLSVASDMGKAFGWSFGLSLIYFPLWVVIFMAAFFGLVGYGFQWLLIHRFISLPYVVVLFLCLIAGCSICWFNTICYVLCIKHFSKKRSFALSLSTGFNGVSAALYTLIANEINSNDYTLYLLLNAIVHVLISCLVLFPILHQPHSGYTIRHDSPIFLCLNILALVTGLYLLFSYSFSSSTAIARVILVGAIFLLLLLSYLPTIVNFREWSCFVVPMSFFFYSTLARVDSDGDELYKELIHIEDNARSQSAQSIGEKECCLVDVLGREQITMLGEEHSTKLLMKCGTSGYTTLHIFMEELLDCRLLAVALDFLSRNIHFERNGWFAVALVPTPIAFILLSIYGSEVALHIGIGLIGLSSGFVFFAAVSITLELFGANSVGMNHNILITNIPLGSCLYGLLAALVYDSNGIMNSTHSIWL
ncbi:hypothetical protein Fmac_028347 [Flemingia macrophylla]|uniref:Nodulin-like domain-containing protein n=1 Tax=Flemingia macrophylla TaxID=520843 RepID=A0ABD1L785_9FABA